MGNVSSVKDGRRFLPIHELCSPLSESHVEFFMAHMLSLGVTLPLPSLEMTGCKESLTVRHPYSIGEGRGGFVRQEVCQTLVWNEARRTCWRNAASEGDKILKDAASDVHDLDNLGDPDKDFAISCSSRFVARLYDQRSFAFVDTSNVFCMDIWMDVFTWFWSLART
jgi:hypothetical protein